MQQLEIQFFWPLTEQIPLDLDYTDCDIRKFNRPNHTNLILSGPSTGIVFAPTTYTTSLDVENNFYFKYAEEPPWYRKILLKLIGFKWRK